MRSTVLLSGLIIAAASLTARAARAGDQEYPVSFVERPLTLPKLTLAPQLELDIDRIGVSSTGPTGASISASSVVAGMQIGASFGITKDLEVGAVVLPIQFNQGAGYGGLFVGEEASLAQPTIFGTFRFLHTEALELGVRLRIQFLVPSDSLGLGAGAIIEPSVPLLLHIGKIGRLDAELGLPITAASASDPVTGTKSTHAAVGLDLPLKLAFDIIEPLHIGVSTGIRVDDFSDAGTTAAIPLGVFMGYAIGEKRPLIDIDPFFSFFDFITPGGGLFGDKINPGIFVFGISARGYIYL